VTPRPCITCGRLIPSGSYCPAHRPQQDRTRGWALRQLRRQVFAVYGERCARCGAEGVAIEVHHIDGDYRNDDLSNLEPLCFPCHPRDGRPPG
jgi:predicted restriction endonuclease